MLAIALIYGSIAGLITIASIIISIIIGGVSSSPGAQWLGYLIMILALSLIFFGTKRYRDREHGGVIKFSSALRASLMIAIVASITYVVTWEIYQALTDYSFITQYTQSILTQWTAEGMTGAALETQVAQLKEIEAQFANPFFRLAITFTEIFPVGLIVALISAVLLRNPKFAPART